mgnify:CR=1 FL=1
MRVLYSYSIAAVRRSGKNGLEVNTASGTVHAEPGTPDHEVKYWAETQARSYYPTHLGYSHHVAGIMRIPDSQLEVTGGPRTNDRR